MIASLSGVVQSTASSFVVLDVNGVGYLVSVTPQIGLAASVGQALSLHTALVVREDSMTLFGFTEGGDLELFDLLRSVTGVGPKLALAILGTLGGDQVRDAVASEDDAAFKSVSGVGPKTAKVIAATLAGKIHPAMKRASGAKLDDSAELTAALVGLGWNERAASNAIREAESELADKASRETILKLALARLAAGKTIIGGEQ